MRRVPWLLPSAALGLGGAAACHPGTGSGTKDGAASGCPMFKKAASTPSSACPVVSRAADSGDDEVINPLNMMPATSQEPAADQQRGLSTSRVDSTIPKGDGGTWVYPSPQMFFNALRRKGKSAEGQEAAMDAVVAIHNNMNELTWKQVLEWEALHCDTCKEERKLLRFVGRPDELTAKAAVRYYLGLSPRPFDRHDWTVDRCGTEVRYVIDYYDVPEAQDKDRLPKLEDGPDAVPSIRIDVRPALDSPTAALDRVKMFSRNAVSAVTAAVMAQPPAASPAIQSSGGDNSRTLTPEQRLSLPYVNLVRERCADRMAALKQCATEQECAIAHIGLTMCIAEQVCTAEADAFKSGGGKSGEDAEKHFKEVQACVATWGADAAAANQ
ncbi:hypothetical protein AB1Y20_018933 [Prymnesium parvum]|uniref:Holocytochrome c-type synthase n=1 Tax=Prymnesium parvum TaxID=97485 RepID=A0AB34JTW8_PRYPA